MSHKYTISCASLGERDVALIKSLLGIVGKVAGAEWEFSEAQTADVVIIDTDQSRVGSLDPKPRAVITYASPDKTLVPNTFALYKPARARDLMEVLTSVHERLVAAGAGA